MTDEAVKAAAEALKDPLVLGEGWEVLVGLTDRERQVAARAVVERVREHIFREVGVAMLQLEDIQAERDAARAEAARYRAALEAFFDHEDTHEPGPLVHDGNFPITGDPVQICADEDCGEYWPCATEQLRRAALDGEEPA